MDFSTGTYANRRKARNITIISIDGVNVTGIFRDATYTESFNAVDVGAVKDGFVLTAPGRMNNKFDVTVVGEGADVCGAKIGTVINFTHNIAGSSIIGSGLLVTSTTPSGGVDGAQTQTFSVEVHGIQGYTPPTA